MIKTFQFLVLVVFLLSASLLSACGPKQPPATVAAANTAASVATVESTATLVVPGPTSTIESPTPTLGTTPPLVGDEFFGAVTVMASGSWTVGGYVFVLTPATEIKDTIQVGNQVKVHFVINADGTYTATEIELNN